MNQAVQPRPVRTYRIDIPGADRNTIPEPFVRPQINPGRDLPNNFSLAVFARSPRSVGPACLHDLDLLGAKSAGLLLIQGHTMLLLLPMRGRAFMFDAFEWVLRLYTARFNFKWEFI
jgi:hypothetical protein